MASQSRDLSSGISSLHIDTAPKSKPTAKTVADSWEDEAEEKTPTDDRDPSTEASELNSPVELSRQSTNFNPHPPPPTPASPTSQTFSYSSLEEQPSRSSSGRSQGNATGASTPERRPDKTTATASRLIAAGLGLRAPKRTEEEKEYDRTMRANARKAREREKEEERRREAEKEKAKAAIWED